MKPNDPQGTSADVLGTALTLAQMIKENPEALDKATFEQGQQALDYRVSREINLNFKNFRELRIEVLGSAIFDLSDRGRVLSKSFFGISIVKNRLQTFVCDLGKGPEGQEIFRIGLKDVEGLQQWRSGQSTKNMEEDLHSGIYFLTTEWSRLL